MSRELTSYELRVLIRNEIQNMAKDISNGSVITNNAKCYAQQILKYISEYEALEPLED